MRFDLLPAKYLSRFPSQAGKKGKFACRQDNGLSGAGYLLACQINLEIADDNAGIGLPVPPPSDDRLEASVEFRNRKRFRQVIICAQASPFTRSSSPLSAVRMMIGVSFPRRRHRPSN